MIKNVVKNIILYPFSYYKRVQTSLKINQTNNKRIFIFDIDNTVADTLPSLEVQHWKNESERVKTLAIFIKMHRLLKVLYSNKNNKIFFLTARSYLSFDATFFWLKEMNIPVEKDEVIITRTAKEKKRIFQNLNMASLNIYYFDDLAYLEKNNRLILYNDLIDYFTNLSNQNKIKYYGLKELNKFIHKNQ